MEGAIPRSFSFPTGLRKSESLGCSNCPKSCHRMDAVQPALRASLSMEQRRKNAHRSLQSKRASPPTSHRIHLVRAGTLRFASPAVPLPAKNFQPTRADTKRKPRLYIEHLGRWYRIALQRGSAWVERANAEGFLAYPASLTSDRFLNHMRNDWDGRLWQQPGVQTSAPVPARMAASFTGTDTDRCPRNANGPRRKLGPCSPGNRKLRERIRRCDSNRGFIPAHRTSGATSVWFSSRGC